MHITFPLALALTNKHIDSEATRKNKSGIESTGKDGRLSGVAIPTMTLTALAHCLRATKHSGGRGDHWLIRSGPHRYTHILQRVSRMFDCVSVGVDDCVDDSLLSTDEVVDFHRH